MREPDEFAVAPRDHGVDGLERVENARPDGVGDLSGLHGAVKIEVDLPERLPLLAIAALDGAHDKVRQPTPPVERRGPIRPDHGTAQGRLTRGGPGLFASCRRPFRSQLRMTRSPLVLAALAALMGAAGVALAAASVHMSGGVLAERGALFLVLHAIAALGIAAHARLALSRALLAAGFVMEAGASLFAADLAWHAFTGGRLFPFAAPIGGTAMIVSWLALTGAFAAEAVSKKAPGR